MIMNIFPKHIRDRIPRWLCRQQFAFTLTMMLLSAATTLVAVRVLSAAPEPAPGPEPAVLAAEAPEPRESLPEVSSDAEAVARVLYGMRNNDTEDLKMVVWCVVNRVESPLFPDTVEGVCAQPSQWVGYSDSNPVLDEFYNMANAILAGWQSGGHRPFATDYLWFDWSADDIVFRTNFEQDGSCKYWRN